MENKRKLSLGLIAISALILIGFYYFSSSVGNFAASDLYKQNTLNLHSLDTNPYAVDMYFSPAAPTSIEQMTFNARVSMAGLTGYSISSIRIYVDNKAVKECPGTVSSCSYTGGPYTPGTHSAYASSILVNAAGAEVYKVSETKSFTVTQYQNSNADPGNGTNSTIPENNTNQTSGNGTNNTNQTPNQPPSIGVYKNPYIQTSADSVTFTANASDSDGTVEEITIYVDEVGYTCSNTNTCVWNYGTQSAGTHSYSAIAVDEDGASSSSGTTYYNVTHYQNNTGNNTNQTSGNGTNNQTWTCINDYTKQYGNDTATTTNCGDTGYSANYCSGNNVVRNYTYTCSGGSCGQYATQQLVQECGSGSTCSNGSCVTNNNTNNTSPGNGTNQSSPSTTTNSASFVSSGSATLNGASNPNGASSTAWFRYSSANPGSCSNSFGIATAEQDIGSGTSSESFSRNVNALSASTTYYYCAIAQNSGGYGFGSIQTFTTQNSGNNSNQTGNGTL